MKKITIKTIAVCFLLSSATYAQVTTPANVANPPPEFLGWDNTGFAKHLDIKNQFGTAFNINFFTNGAPGIQRMTILGSNGNVGIGTGFTAPASMLHLHNGIFGTFAQFTNVGTGA